MKTFTKLFLALLSFDLVTKTISTFFESTVYNKQMIFNLDFGLFSKFVFPCIAIPFFLLTASYLDKKQKPVYLALFFAGFIGNYIYRFTEMGVPDFIPMFNSVANIADGYIWASYLYFAGCIVTKLVKKEEIKPQVAEPVKQVYWGAYSYSNVTKPENTNQ